jgi:acetyl esterase/lipase
MTAMDLRFRLLGALARPASSISKMPRERVLKMQRHGLRHNRVTDRIFGAVAPAVALEDQNIEGPGGALPVRVYRLQTEPSALVVHLHGGGWTLGTLEQSDWLCSHVSAATGAVVVSVDYRLAPLNPFPAAVEDAYAALLWAAEKFSADGRRIGVMGDSAGGNLAAVVALLARDRSGPPISHQALIYPATDQTLSGASMQTNANKPFLLAADVVAYRRHYLGDPPTAIRDPYASPLHADDHSGLPPALIQVAEHDPIRDDGTRYAEALRAAGVTVRLTEYVGVPHGFMSFPGVCRSAHQALAEICAEQSSALALN